MHLGEPVVPEDVERVIEGKLPERDRILGRLSECVIPGHGTAGSPRIRPARVRDDDDPLQGGKLASDRVDTREGVVYPAVVEVSIGGEENLGFDLAKTIDHATRAEVR